MQPYHTIIFEHHHPMSGKDTVSLCVEKSCVATVDKDEDFRFSVADIRRTLQAAGVKWEVREI